ncbi:hypothetical protein TUM19329_32470 [Legionella antarctica]|uniref:Uncharacterized protein n=1 Tax=Legionella antarctica TaxID=2708020 RepID=A0A6F8TA77_9GAMM|nr:hypothetical protein [Legionella antarctica]BCA96886.1 hypothetical protein TUM19329_32470 [Legionella antarctica]
MKHTLEITKQISTKNQLKTDYVHTLKQVKRDYRELIQKLNNSGDNSVVGTGKIVREFGEKIVNQLILMQVDAQKLGKDGHRLPSFIKQRDLLAMKTNMPMLFNKLLESDNFLCRLLGADKKKALSHERLIKRVDLLKEVMKDDPALPHLLPYLEKFERGTLKQFNDYIRWKQSGEHILKSLTSFSIEFHEDSLQSEKALILSQILGSLNRISNQLIEKETLTFIKKDEYKFAGAARQQKKTLNTHLDQFREFLPLEEQLDFLERILHSQDKVKRKRNPTEEERKIFNQAKEDKKQYAPLFKRNAKAEKNDFSNDIISKLAELRETLATVEAKRVMYEMTTQKQAACRPKIEQKPNHSNMIPLSKSSPSQKRKIEHSSPETTEPKKRKYNYEFKIRFFMGELSGMAPTKKVEISKENPSPAICSYLK